MTIGMQAGRWRRSGWLALVSVCLIAIGAPASRGEQNEPLARFFLDQAPPQQSPRHRTARPEPSRRHAPRFTEERRPTASPPPQVAATKPAAQPGFSIGVFGDEFGAAAARGLSLANEAMTATIVLDQTGDDGELTRQSPDGWAKLIEATIAKSGRLDVAVVMLGGDEVGLDAGPDSPSLAADWRKTYGDQVEALAAAFRDCKIPLIWVGLPPVRDEPQGRRFLELNAIYRDRAVKAGATFVDSWEAFTDENGGYAVMGPDVDGQPAKLRRSDGYGFTKTGARKLASFLESDLKQLRDRLNSSRQLASVPIDDQKTFDQALQVDVNAQIRREAGLPTSAASLEGNEADGPVISLTAAPVTAGGRLATLYDPGTRPTDHVAVMLEKGITPPARTGRTDDFTWPRR